MAKRKIIGISGSIRPNSATRLAVLRGLAFVDPELWETELIDLKELRLPFCDSSDHYPDFPDVEVLREKVRQSHGVLLGTPEYHGSLSGVLKNALDLLTNEQVEGKVFGLISVLGGTSSMNAVNHMRTICRQLHAWTVPQQLLIPNSDLAFDSEGNILDPDLEERLEELLEHLCLTIEKFDS